MFEATATSSGHRLAAKILHPRHERDAAARARFEREAELSRSLQHPNIVRVLGVRPIDQRTALMMELVEGPTLAAALATEGPLPREVLIAIARGVASGLAYAHARGVIHRDLKPANILLTPDRVAKIADFGMARAASFAAADKRALTVLGTPPYMAPECLDPLAVDPRTDLYALGCILFEMATGAPPYGGPTPYAVLDAHRTAPIPDLPEAYGAELDALVKRLLAKAPGDRPQAGTAVVDALARLDGTAALVPVGPARLQRVTGTGDGRCASCGADVLAELRVCVSCGMVQVFVEPGPYSVFVVGPGRISHKFSSELRDTLVQWVRANEGAGLDASDLEKRIPRLAFPLSTGLSQASAQTLAAAMRHLGIHAEIYRGGPSAHPAVKRAAGALMRRSMGLAAAVFAAPVLLNPLLGAPVTLAGIVLVLPFVVVFSRRSAFRCALQIHERNDRHALPPAVQAQLDGLIQAVGALHEQRHRDALRAVVHRTVDLTRTLPTDQRDAVAPEMAHAINLATVATRRMDELDATMAHAAFDPADPHHRAQMRERDLWSARLLDLTATLDALAARRAAASHAIDEAHEAATLAALRATVESLEEVQRL